MNGIGTGFLIRATVCIILALFVMMSQSYDVRAAGTCVACHTDEEILVKSLGESGKEKSSLQAGPG